MNKVKTFQLLPLVMLSSMAFAETTTNVQQENVANVTARPVVENNVVSDAILPQLSFSAQQARAAALAKQADYALEQEQIRQEEARKFAEAEAKVKQTVGNSPLLLGKTVTQIYLDNEFAPMWVDKNAEKQFLKEYALFAASGVSGKSARALQQILNQPEGLARDMLLTDGFLDYLYYNKNVYKNANQWLYNLGSYSPKSPSTEQISQWVKSTKNGSSGQFVANLVPRNHIYQETAQRVLSMSAGGAKKAKTEKKAKNSASDNAPVASAGSEAFYKLALNTQRLRIIPSFNNGIFVNIPSYQLYYFKNGQLALQSKVIVGRDDRRTPVMYSKLSNVVVNPPWNIPPTILTKDIVPKLARNPGFAEAAGYEIFDGKGNKINPRSVNWSQYVNSKSLPYRIRQKARDDSALGRFKFNMPSSDAIYLHDTPNRGLFSKTDRALSSGCVRVERSDELASILLKEAGWSMDKKQQVLASEKTTSANIRSDNPVYLYYVTSWVENGKVYTLPDIYKLDVAIPKNAVNWSKVRSVI
ncbi:L,D-transpeptidase family protein [Actinobacillus genomosp. 2]|uniref:L,D-transpeptidase family protein n=1 Tax=Actinobacillus genomosp. 2 TaxID=230709 RepID=UPI002441EC04|nr:L,D-transpeptidase family protein [Actinobacillus genomosp. 2]WGE31221.1 L,D-transpeptidase family protein [Actinobacillus genomosp. 2]